jgi:hypothetical protein
MAWLRRKRLDPNSVSGFGGSVILPKAVLVVELGEVQKVYIPSKYRDRKM